MSEKIISLNNLELVKLFGTNNNLFSNIKNLFPEIKIVSRGENIIVKGSQSKIMFFEEKLSLIINHINHYNSLDINSLEKIVSSISSDKIKYEDDIILHGVNGKTIKARTDNQRKIKSAIDKKDMIFAIGPAGTGKTYTAVALAVKALKNKTVKRIIFTRPAVEAGEGLGFLPGDLKEKLDPYMQPIYDALFDMIHIEKLNDFIDNGTIQIAPLAFMRGRTLDKAFVILDEGQNTTIQQMKMFLTRMGKSAKFIITGDETQVDLPKNKKSGLTHAKMKLNKIKEISFVHLDSKDIIRHNIVTKIINEYKKDD
ncbi:PhoH family protein [Flavobacteriales bacterium]|jgi:phosphate starvation-inducible PhoH-like protein|nr:PhoH family protein [Flavobacteriales bacterium]